MEATDKLPSKGGEAIKGGLEQEEIATEDVEEHEEGDGEDMLTFNKFSCGCWCFTNGKKVPFPLMQVCCLY